MSRKRNIVPKSQRLWTGYFLSICIVSLLSGITMYIFNNSLSMYMFSVYGSTSYTGYLATGFCISAVAARILAGRLSDRFGRRKLHIAGLLIFVAATVCFTCSKSFAAFLAFRTLQGFGFGIANTTMMAMGIDVVPENRVSESSSIVSAGYCLAATFSAALTLALLGDGHYTRTFLVAAAGYLTAAILSSIVKYEKAPAFLEKQSKISEALNAGNNSEIKDLMAYKGLARVFEFKALPASITGFLLGMTVNYVTVYLLLYATQAGIETASLFFTLAGFTTLAVRFVSGSLTHRFGPLTVVVISAAAGALCFSILLFTTDPIAFLIAGAGYGILNGASMPTLYAVAIQSSPANRHGTATATFYWLSNDLSNGPGILLWSVIIDLFGFKASFFACLLFIAAGLISAFVTMNRRRLIRIGVPVPQGKTQAENS